MDCGPGGRRGLSIDCNAGDLAAEAAAAGWLVVLARAIVQAMQDLPQPVSEERQFAQACPVSEGG